VEVEVVGGAMLIVPWTATVGALAVAGVMGGAWITRFLDERYVDVAWISGYVVALLWVMFTPAEATARARSPGRAARARSTSPS